MKCNLKRENKGGGKAWKKLKQNRKQKNPEKQKNS
jgi:hypothetical protein